MTSKRIQRRRPRARCLDVSTVVRGDLRKSIEATIHILDLQADLMARLRGVLMTLLETTDEARVQ